jgi:excisionase family DNA binding protein
LTADERTPARAIRRPKLLTLKQVADQLSVNERHVRRLVAERRIPYVKWGHLLRFDPDEIAEWFDGGRRRTA